MTEKPKETPKEELECPKKYVYDTGIIFECKDNIRVEIIGEDVVDLLNELATKCSKLEKENEQLKSDNNRLVNETAKVVAEHQRKVFELIDEKINLLENDYEKAVKGGMPSNSVYGEIELLEELKKELQE